MALTSYYGKTFLTRGRLSAKDYGHWLKNQLMMKFMDRDSLEFKDPLVESAYDPAYQCPRAYSAAAAVITSVKMPEYELSFDHKAVAASYDPKALAKAATNKLTVFGKTIDNKAYLGMDDVGRVYQFDVAGKIEGLGTFESFMGIDATNSPVEYVTVSVFGKEIPLGVVLGLLMGLDKLLKTLNVKYQRVPIGEKVKLEPHQYSLIFSDEYLIFDKQDKLASLILGGFNEYERALRLFSVYSFDKSGVYVNLLESNKISSHYVREIETANQLFIDPITRDILIERHEPTEYVGLLFEAARLLTNDAHPGELHPRYMRIKGYERVAGAVYAEMINSYREHNGSLNKANSSIRMNPYNVWKRISEDRAKVQSSQINPISSLKEIEAVTMGGTGGRSSVSMTKDTRGFHVEDTGTISEATKDSGDVGINIYTSANPKFTSLRGLSSGFDFNEPNATSMLSTSALLAPFSDRDD